MITKYLKHTYSKPNHKNTQYTGRQLISCIIPDSFNYLDENISINSGNIITGKITSFSLKKIIKAIYHEYGEDITVEFINNIQLITNIWLLGKGFSVGYQDCVIKDLDKKLSNKIEKEIRRIESLNMDEYILNIEVNNIRNISQKICVDTISERNNTTQNSILQMVNSGAKGSITNFCQIVALLGQQNIRGKRPEKTLSKNTRTIPHFKPGDISLEASGFCFGSYSKGLSPSEYFFHCQGAREGLINTGANTPKTGYIQRKFCKSLEDVKVCYDNTIRFGDKIIQFGY